MPLKQFAIDFLELAKEASNRFDVDFADFNKNERQERYSFRDLFEIVNSTKKERMDLIDHLDDDFYYAEIGNVTKQGDVEPEKLNFSNINELVADYFKKIEKGDIQKSNENDILLAKVRPNLRKYVFVDEKNKDYFYTTAFINLKPRKLNKIFYYAFRTIFYNDLMAISRQGKGYPTLKEDDLFYLKFSKAAIDKLEKLENEIISQIEPIENKIKELKNQISPAQEAMNKVFAREFGFDLEKIHKIDNDRKFYIDLSLLDFKNNNLRSSYRWSQLERVQGELYKNNDSIDFLGKFIKSTKNGWSPECNEDEGGQAILGIDSIQKNGKMTFGNPKYTQQTRNNSRDFFVQNGDFFVSRGNTLGLVALAAVAKVESEDKEFIYPDLMIKIKFDENEINKEYIAYAFNSIIGRIYFKYSAKGKNQTMVKISSKELYDFELPIPDIKRQQKIVDEIKAELDKQEEMKKKIEVERKKIDEIIEKAIK
ncbi:MAG: restriction endonuclease subunit S [Parcubacteria group bacterium]|jgi:type I restriction enzyme S subunit